MATGERGRKGGLPAQDQDAGRTGRAVAQTIRIPLARFSPAQRRLVLALIEAAETKAARS
jgi:hypothetical protein